MERDVLTEALAEAGFTKAKPEEEVPADASVVELLRVRSAATQKRKSPSREYIEVKVPAYIAAAHLDVCDPLIGKSW